MNDQKTNFYVHFFDFPAKAMPLVPAGSGRMRRVKVGQTNDPADEPRSHQRWFQMAVGSSLNPLFSAQLRWWQTDVECPVNLQVYCSCFGISNRKTPLVQHQNTPPWIETMPDLALELATNIGIRKTTWCFTYENGIGTITMLWLCAIRKAT